VIVLDENILESQRSRLRGWRVHLSQIGREVAREGTQDEEIITLLRTLRHLTFVSWDRDFFDRSLCSDRFCLVFMDVPQLEVAEYVRRLLRHPEFKTWARRKGCVLRISASGISVWRARARRAARYRWIG
jgi:hypothetical protein